MKKVVNKYSKKKVILPNSKLGDDNPYIVIKTSVNHTKSAPNKKPIVAGTNANSPFSPYTVDFSAISIAGASNDQYEAAVITPAAKPKLTSSNFLCKISSINYEIYQLTVEIYVNTYVYEQNFTYIIVHYLFF